MKVNICGIPHEVIKVKDDFTASANHLGEIRYLECKIYINDKLPKELEKETICHEMVHGILVHIGKQEMADNEEFVQALANAITQGFEVKEIKDEQS